ncbi:MAG TPA: proton-conducting transporter membrane subunit [Candidatus Binatia bacterium]|nr:proton-conducting transporter membrane subunit [Candidatus Binatia bacterium]
MADPSGPSAFQALLPAWFLLLAALVTALLGWLRPRLWIAVHRLIGGIGVVAALIAEVVLFRGITSITGISLVAYGGSVVVDNFATYSVVLLCGVALVGLLTSGTAAPALGRRAPAYHALLLTAAAGGVVMASGWEMGMLVAGLALLVPSLVGMVAVDKAVDGPGEAGLRQLVGLGVAMAVLVYGLAVVYGATGTTDLSATTAPLAGASPPLEGLGLALVIVGLASLVGAAPLHDWLLQVARASRGAVAGTVIALAVTSGGVALVRVLVSGFSASLRPWVVLAGVLAAIACLYAALLSIAASTVRRLIALGASLQGGLLIAALVGGGLDNQGRAEGGVDALLFGLAVFALSVLAGFLALALLEADGMGARISDLRGLSRRSPLAAGLLALGLAGLAGAPPLAGFIARVLIAGAAMAGGYGWVALATVAASLIYAIPALRALAAIFVEDEDAPALAGSAPLLARAGAVACAVFGVVASVVAGPLIYVANLSAISLR